VTVSSGSLAEVQLGGRRFTYQKPWAGRPLTDRGYLAFDTETEAVGGDHEIPRLALAAACAGPSAACLVHPDQVAAFVLAHPRARWVFHNAAFDFWVVDRHLRDRDAGPALRAWWDACDGNRMSDTMLLDQLIELARRDADPRPRDLAALGRQYARLEITKDDPYRLRYGEVIGKGWDEVEDGFFTYAMKDAIVTSHAYRRMALEAERLVYELGRHSPDLGDDAIARFGLLTESIQVKGAVALAAVSRAGMHLDLDRVRATEADLRARLEGLLTTLQEYYPGLFKTKTDRRTGEVTRRLNPGSGTPSRSDKALQEELARVVDRLGRETGRTPDIPRTSKGLSQSVKVWAEYAGADPFLRSWVAYEELSRLCQFFAGLRDPVVHPTYRPLLRTGRTSCSGPNVQQVPRDSRFRQAFVPRPGHLLLTADYSAIELRALAAVCQQRYGRSVLVEVIKAGVDPHCYTAGLILGVPPEEFMGWKDDETVAKVNGVLKPLRKHFKEARQAAKAVNFGVPGGLGAASLVAYARGTYKVEMTVEQAQAFRSKLITEVYPELDRYLSEDGMAVLAHSLGVPARDLWDAFDPEGTRSPRVVAGVRNVVRGRTHTARGQPYSSGYVERVWRTLLRFCRDSGLRPALEARRGSEALAGRLFGAGVMTLTGRVRAGVSYSQCRNTPFQGLAADGAKLAVWRLASVGYRVVGFVHDEVLVELPDRGGYVPLAEVERVEAILCGAMEEVLGGGIPVACESAVSTCWSKDAERVVCGDTVLAWSPGGVG
jgi:hypothetical protein